MTPEETARAIAAGGDVERDGDDFVVLCPNCALHRAPNSVGSILVGEHPGRVTLACSNQCKVTEILDAADLDERDLRLVDDDEEDHEPARSGVLRELRAVRASGITPARVDWLWPGWIPASRLVLATGRPGDGKSTLMTDLVARFTTTTPLPDGHRLMKAINCAILSAEDAPDDTIVPRLLAAGADLDRVHIIGGIFDSETGLERPWILPDDMLELSDLVESNEIGFVVIDPLTAFASARVDTHRDGAVRAMLLPLSNMAHDLTCGVAAVRHNRKGGARDARDAGGGSIAFTAAARVELTIGADPHDESKRVIAVAKSNIARKPRSFVFHIAQDERWETNRIVWDGTTDLTADDLTAEPTADEDKSAVDEAADFLRQVLADGPLPSKEVERQAHEVRISMPALKRGRRHLKIKAKRTGDEWTMSLPKGDHQGDHSSGDARLEPLDPLEPLSSTHTLTTTGFTREDSQGAQGDQGAQSQDRCTSSEDDDEVPGCLDDIAEWCEPLPVSRSAPRVSHPVPGAAPPAARWEVAR
jgi:hypothetical protein